jgi:hypothetical protein
MKISDSMVAPHKIPFSEYKMVWEAMEKIKIWNKYSEGVLAPFFNLQIILLDILPVFKTVANKDNQLSEVPSQLDF